ncbi:putative Zn(II)2Cys6 transcription factor [Aspergillus steynii IBT 23096]|uniref:Putative Zn(II)2Cys6 transcription factor n=1 Tax=Aspergillus steynii IBT 23096 TaxID=1392250 RepID=A0A2I2FWX0_9EURO|nr:putative Zn(II)2Cys6 transcription factor [Aspergillus steynii IBT 23096]PLB45130.1 putative Zn(II)2Cys6 transcription factor [Aspergillus steynii IBT 23096]
MPRRTHKKSRNGCVECKRRHVKCDEKRPNCSNCITSERHCEYAGLKLISSRPLRASRSSSRVSTSPSTAVATQIPLEVSNEISIDSPPVNMLHFELLHHFTTETSKVMGTGDIQLTLADALKYGLSAPYLMNQFLALSALHLSLVRPAQQKHYRHSASQLQTHALSIYNTNRPEINQETCVATLLFSSMIGIHTLCDSLNYRESDFMSFLDRFVDCLHLHQGVRAVAKSSWTTLRESDLEPVLAAGEALPKLGATLTPEFMNLLKLIRAAKVGDMLTNTYQQAIEALQSVSSAITSDHNGDYTRNYIVSWLTLIPSEYIDSLTLKRPEAVVILAHYAALLHQQRSSWVFGDSGRFIIQTIDAYLGPPWTDWLVWPKRVLDETPPTPESTSMEQ